LLWKVDQGSRVLIVIAALEEVANWGQLDCMKAVCGCTLKHCCGASSWIYNSVLLIYNFVTVLMHHNA